jgi:tripartite-type tricarboxylate transporter receptor subunit TctC
MLRGIFMPAGVTPDQLAFYVDLLTKVAATPEWKEYMEKGAFNSTFMTGDAFKKWLADAEATHRTLMTEAGFLAANGK